MGKLLKLRNLFVVYFCCTLAFSDILDTIFKFAQETGKLSLVTFSLGNPSDEERFFCKLEALGDQIKQLDLPGCNLSERAVGRLAQFIITWKPHIKTLNLTNNTIDDEGAKWIANAAKENPSLKIIRLGNSNIGDVGAKYFAQVLPSTNVETLILSKNFITDEGASALLEVLPSTKLKVLRLFANQISKECENRIQSELKRKAEWMRARKNLREILPFVYFEEPVSPVETPPTFSIFPPLPSPSAEVPLSELPSAVPSFPLSSPLENLYKEPPVVRPYVQGLPSVPEQYPIRPPHEELPADLPFIPYDREPSSVLPVLPDTVNFGENPIMQGGNPTGQPASKRTRASEEVAESTFCPCVLDSSLGMLKHKKASSSAPIVVRAKKMQDSIPMPLNMINIDLGNPETFKEFIDVVQSNPSINGLILYNCNINESIISFFVSKGILGRLNKLYLDNNPMVGDAGVKILANALTRNTSLINLRLTNCNITDIGVRDLSEALKGNTSLRELALSENIGITSVSGSMILYTLLPNTKIDCFKIEKCSVSHSCMCRIREMLKSKNGQGKCTRESLRKLKKKSYLKNPHVLNFEGKNLEKSKSMEKVISILNSSSAIKELCLSECCIGDVSASILAKALTLNKFLKTVNLGKNNMSDVGTCAIAEALKTNKSLEVLNLFCDNISDVGALAIAEALKVNKSLKVLNLFYNNIGDVGAWALAEALKINTTLEVLNLCSNNISYVGNRILTEALSSIHLVIFDYVPQK